jgi:hypothetical protein
MVAVIVKVDGKSTAKQLSVSIRKRLESVPTLHYIFNLIHTLIPVVTCREMA